MQSNPFLFTKLFKCYRGFHERYDGAGMELNFIPVAEAQPGSVWAELFALLKFY